MTNIAIVGASGFTGLELTKILENHPKIQNLVSYCQNWCDDRGDDTMGDGIMNRKRFGNPHRNMH